MMTDTRIELALVEAFERDGYVLQPCVFPADLLARMTADLDEAIAGDATQPWAGGWVESFNVSDHSLKTSHGLHLKSAAWTEAAEHPLMMAAAAAFMGEPAAFSVSTIVVKPPMTGQPFPLHQDAVYYGKKFRQFLAASVYLDDATDDNGPIRFIPGSHRLGVLEHVRDGKLHLPEYHIEDTVPVMAKRGDVVWFSTKTIHGSYPNRSPHVRRTVRLGYQPVAP